jgi:hypothetical protein
MNKDRFKRIILPLIIIVAGVFYILVDSFSDNDSGKKKKPVAPVVTEKTVAPSPPAQLNMQKGHDAIQIKAVIPAMDNLDSMQSPFSLLSAAGNLQLTSPLPGNGTATTSPLPKAMIPPSATSFRLPNGLNPVLPGAGSVTVPGPGTVREIVVKAILQGANNMSAILGDGKDEIIVSPGEYSDWGYISNITKNSVILNDKVIKLAEQ